MLLNRDDKIERTLRLARISIAWNVLEAVLGFAAGVTAGSVALLGFALDSVVEGSSAGLVSWRLRAERSGRRSAVEAERTAIRGVAIAFWALAAYVAVHALVDLVLEEAPRPSRLGIGLAVSSLIGMPVLAWRKRVAAKMLDSATVRADATQTMLCVALSAVLLVGLAANAAWGWWWADPVAALAIAAIAYNEGRVLWKTEKFCC